MQAVINHIETIKGKPHHVRHHIALLYAGIVAGLIGIIWLAANLSLGTFAIQGSNFAEATGQVPVQTVSPAQASGLAGVAGASAADSGEPAHIEIVNSAPAPAPKAQPTTIPF